MALVKLLNPAFYGNNMTNPTLAFSSGGFEKQEDKPRSSSLVGKGNKNNVRKTLMGGGKNQSNKENDQKGGFKVKLNFNLNYY